MTTPSTIPRPELEHPELDPGLKIPDTVPEFLEATRSTSRRRVLIGLVLAVLAVAAVIAVVWPGEPEGVAVHDGWMVSVPTATTATDSDAVVVHDGWSVNIPDADARVHDGWAVNIPPTEARVHDGWSVNIPDTDAGVHDGWSVNIP